MFILSILARPHPNTALGKIIRAPLRLVPSSAVVPVITGVNKGFRWVAGSGVAGYWVGTFERGKQRVIESIVKPGMVAYDLGANVGFYTLALSRLVGPKGQVLAFEPEPRNILALRRHLELNGIENVTTVQAAVTDCSGLVRFSGTGAAASISSGGSLVVPSVSLDDFIANGYPAPDFIKADVEGAEALVVGGARKLLATRRAIWIIGDDERGTVRSQFDAVSYKVSGFVGDTIHENAQADIIARPG